MNAHMMPDKHRQMGEDEMMEMRRGMKKMPEGKEHEADRRHAAFSKAIMKRHT